MKLKTTITLDEATTAKIKELAAAQHISVSAWINQMVWAEVRRADMREKIVAEAIEKANKI